MKLLIVITIMSILAVAIMPNFIGFDAEARAATSKSNLESIRSRILLFRAKEGDYPVSLKDLTTHQYEDRGRKKKYFKKIPKELISSKKGSSAVKVCDSTEGITNKGGWIYHIDTDEVMINIKTPLDDFWGDLEGEVPSEW